MKIKTSELTGRPLDWAAAKAEGRVLRVPEPATDADLASLQTPFKLYGTTCINSSGELRWRVEEVTITRVGIDETVGATAPSISFTDDRGVMCRGSASMFYLTREAAQADADQENLGGLEGFTPSTDWSQGGPIIERERITLIACDNDFEAQSRTTPLACEEGPTPLIAAMRCFVASRLGDEVDVPDELC